MTDDSFSIGFQWAIAWQLGIAPVSVANDQVKPHQLSARAFRCVHWLVNLSGKFEAHTDLYHPVSWSQIAEFTEMDLRGIRNAGSGTVNEVKEALSARGLAFKNDGPIHRHRRLSIPQR